MNPPLLNLNPPLLKRIATGQNLYRASVLLALYDILKFLAGYHLMVHADINPWIFLFLDLITIPGYFVGWHRLLQTLGEKDPCLGTMLLWGIITFYCSTGPYLYALWSGRHTASWPVWGVLCIIIVLLTVNMIRRICKSLCHIKP